METYIIAACWFALVDQAHCIICKDRRPLWQTIIFAAIWPLSIAYFSLHRAAAKRHNRKIKEARHD